MGATPWWILGPTSISISMCLSPWSHFFLSLLQTLTLYVEYSAFRVEILIDYGSRCSFIIVCTQVIAPKHIIWWVKSFREGGASHPLLAIHFLLYFSWNGNQYHRAKSKGNMSSYSCQRESHFLKKSIVRALTPMLLIKTLSGKTLSHTVPAMGESTYIGLS